MTTPASSLLTAAQLAELRTIDSCAMANAIEETGGQLRNEGYMDSTVACRFANFPPLVGYAFPLRVRTSGPPVAGRSYVDRTDWWEQLLAVPQPRVLVVEDMESHPGTGAVLGEVHANIYKALGCVGVITNGAVRDVLSLRQLGFAAFSSHVSVSHAYTHVVDVGNPIVVGGLKVHLGDLMHGDRHGVLCIPAAMAAELPSIVARQKIRERTLIDYCRSTGFSIEGLRSLLQHSQPI
jgi:regulator of RNase E activity RraA